MYQRVLVASLFAIQGCSSSGSRPGPKAEPVTPTPLTTTCPDPILADGSIVCDPKPGAQIVDLRDAWTPRLFSPTDGPEPAFRATYLQLASEQTADGKPLPQTQAFTELYGVLP